MMRIDTVEALFIDESVTVTEAELIDRSGLTDAELHALVESGAFAPLPDAAEWTFTVQCLTIARTASRLRDEFALEDTHALAVVLRLTQRVGELQGELQRLRGARHRPLAA